MTKIEDPKSVKPIRKDVLQKYKDEIITYKTGEYGLVEGESLMDGFAGLFTSNIDEVKLQEGVHILFKNFDPESHRSEYSFDKLIFDNPKKLPFAYFIENDNTYVFLKDEDRIISSVKLEGYTAPDYTVTSHYENKRFAIAVSGNESVTPIKMNLSSEKLKESLINQIEELVTTGTNTWSKKGFMSEQSEILSKLAEHLKIDDLKAETSLAIEKAKFKLNNKNNENYLPK